MNQEFFNLERTKFLNNKLTYQLVFFVLICAISLSIGFSLNFVNPFFVLFFLLVIFSIPIALTSITNGVIVFLIFASFSDFFKRLIFLFDKEAPEVVYYGIVLLPDVIFFLVLFNIFWRTNFSQNLRAKMSFPILIFFGWNILNLLNPLSPLATKVAGFKLFSVYILAYLVGYAFSHEVNLRKIKRSIVTIFIIGLISSVYGIYQFYNGYSIFEMNWLESGKASINIQMLSMFDVKRSFSVFSDIHNFGIFMGLCLFISLYLPKKWKTGKLVSVFLAPIFLLGLGASLARGVWLGFILGIVVLNLNEIIKISNKLMVLLGVILISIFMFLREFLFLVQKIGLTSGIPFIKRALLAGTFYGRVKLFWIPAAKQILLNKMALIFGSGIGSASSAAKFGETKGVIADNLYLQIIYQLGIIGLILFFIIIGHFFNNFSKSCRKLESPWMRFLTLVGVAYIILVLIDGIVGPSLDARPTNFIFWFFLGYLGSLGKGKDEDIINQ